MTIHPMRPALLPALALLGALPWSMTQAAGLGPLLDAAWARTGDAHALDARRAATAAQADVAAGWLAGAPVLATELRSDRATGNDGARELDVGVELPLWQPGEAEARGRLAGDEAGRLEAETQARRLALAGELREAAWALRIAEAAQRHAQRREREAGRLLVDADRRLRAGELAEAEALAARAAHHATQLARLDAEAGLAEARRDWQLLSAGAALPARIEERAAPAPAQHPQRLAALAATRSAAGRAALAGRSPDERTKLGFGVRSERASRHGDDEYSLAVAVSIPFGGERFRRAEVETARAELAEAAAEEARLTDALPAGLAAAQTRLALERERLTLVQASLRLARERAALAERAQQLGQIDQPALLAARAAAFDAEALAELQGLYTGRAVARLNQAQGVLP